MEKRKRTIFWIIPIGVIGIFIYLFGPKDAITDNEYISYIKASPLIEDSMIIAETAFANHCEKTGWEYFQTKMFEHVVEFKGECQVDNTVQPINLQFIVEKDQSSHRIGAMLINGEAQTEQQRSVFLTMLQQ
jgi:hypothetical protein